MYASPINAIKHLHAYTAKLFKKLVPRDEIDLTTKKTKKSLMRKLMLKEIPTHPEYEDIKLHDELFYISKENPNEVYRTALLGQSGYALGVLFSSSKISYVDPRTLYMSYRSINHSKGLFQLNQQVHAKSHSELRNSTAIVTALMIKLSNLKAYAAVTKLGVTQQDNKQIVIPLNKLSISLKQSRNPMALKIQTPQEDSVKPIEPLIKETFKGDKAILGLGNYFKYIETAPEFERTSIRFEDTAKKLRPLLSIWKPFRENINSAKTGWLENKDKTEIYRYYSAVEIAPKQKLRLGDLVVCKGKRENGVYTYESGLVTGYYVRAYPASPKIMITLQEAETVGAVNNVNSMFHQLRYYFPAIDFKHCNHQYSAALTSKEHQNFFTKQLPKLISNGQTSRKLLNGK